MTFASRSAVLDLVSFVLFRAANFNDKLKKLRKENTIVPVKQLIDVVLQQFEGERGAKFESACATFCQNQGEAMKLLQSKMKQHATDKFSLFLNVSDLDLDPDPPVGHPELSLNRFVLCLLSEPRTTPFAASCT